MESHLVLTDQAVEVLEKVSDLKAGQTWTVKEVGRVEEWVLAVDLVISVREEEEPEIAWSLVEAGPELPAYKPREEK